MYIIYTRFYNDENVTLDQIKISGQDEHDDQFEEIGFDLAIENGFDVSVSGLNDIVTSVNAAVDGFDDGQKIKLKFSVQHQ